MLRLGIMVAALVGVAGIGLAGCSCEAEPETAIMVEVDSDIPLALLDRVRLQVDSVEAGDTLTNRLDVEYRLAERAPGEPGGSVEGTSEVRLPIRVAVLPRGSNDAAIHLRAAGTAPGADAPNVAASARLTFVPDRTLLLRLFLVEVCIDVVCEEGQTCAEIGGEGICVDEEIDRPECALDDLEAGQVEGCVSVCETPADCDDGTDCTTDGCQNGLCTHESACRGTTPVCCDGACAECCGDGACDDGLDCTTDACAAGSCTHESACGCEDDLECDGARCCDGACLGCCGDEECDDGDGCTVDSCEAGACHNTPLECPDPGDPCVTVACVAGACTPTPVCAAEQVCCGGACNTQCCDDSGCAPDGDCYDMYCSAGLCHKDALPDRTPCPGGICEQATERCLECLGQDDCSPELLCCEGACQQCCVAADCPPPSGPCVAAVCGDGGVCGEECLPDGTDCEGGLTCQSCICQ